MMLPDRRCRFGSNIMASTESSQSSIDRKRSVAHSSAESARIIWQEMMPLLRRAFAKMTTVEDAMLYSSKYYISAPSPHTQRLLFSPALPPLTHLSSPIPCSDSALF